MYGAFCAFHVGVAKKKQRSHTVGSASRNRRIKPRSDFLLLFAVLTSMQRLTA
jgi:hypothetical protein